MALAASGAAVLALLAVLLFGGGGSGEQAGTSPPKEGEPVGLLLDSIEGEQAGTPPPKEGPQVAEDQPPVAPLEKLLAECELLLKQGRLGQAIEKLDEHPTVGESDPEVAKQRIKEMRDRAVAKAGEILGRVMTGVKALAVDGRLEEAGARMAEVDRLGIRDLETGAYREFRRAAEEQLARRRKASAEGAALELARLRTVATAPAKPPSNPEASGKEAEALYANAEWGRAAELLTVLSSAPEWRARALTKRAWAHHNAGRFVEVLHDVELLLEGGDAPRPALAALGRSLRRAPVDEAFRLWCERALAKGSGRSALWVQLATLHLWRQDLPEAVATLQRASERKALTGEDRRMMDALESFRVSPFPPASPVYVAYAGSYEVLTDASPELARALAGHLREIEREYSTLFPSSRNPDLRFRCLLFADRVNFSRFCRASRDIDPETAIAFYSPIAKQLVVDGSDEDFLMTVRHEAFHQMLDCYVDDAPRGFDEGSASYFETSTPGRPAIHPWRVLEAAMEARGGRPSLREVLNAGRGRWKEMNSPYGLAWSIVYFLHTRGHESVWRAYLKALIEGAGPDAAFDRAFRAVDEKTFEREWSDWLMSIEPPRPGDGKND